jgi:3-oxoacyl-[acyl-carrier-protein] synthase-1
LSQLDKLYIAATGVITPIGFKSAMTASSVKAGLSRTVELPLLNKRLSPIKMSLIPEDALPTAYEQSIVSRESRMLAMADVALKEAIDNTRFELNGKIPLFLAVPETLPGCVCAVQNTFVETLAELSGLAIDVAQSRLFYTGRAGGMHAIDMAFRYMQATAADVVIVGGVDTFLDPYLLGTLDSQNRLLGAESGDGFIPSESAAFVVLVSESIANKHTENKLGNLYIPAFSNEEGHLYGDKPYLGEALSQAVSNALALASEFQVTQLFTSLNGESYGSKELGVALNRNSDRLEGVSVEHPADCFGDIGAAFVPAVLALLTSNNESKNTIICSSSDLQDRAAMCVST